MEGVTKASLPEPVPHILRDSMARIRLQWLLLSLNRPKNSVASSHRWEKAESKRDALALTMKDLRNNEEGVRAALEMHDLCMTVGCLMDGEARFCR